MGYWEGSQNFASFLVSGFAERSSAAAVCKKASWWPCCFLHTNLSSLTGCPAFFVSFLLLCWEHFSLYFYFSFMFESGSHCVVQASLKCPLFLLQLPECSGYKSELHRLTVSQSLGIFSTVCRSIYWVLTRVQAYSDLLLASLSYLTNSPRENMDLNLSLFTWNHHGKCLFMKAGLVLCLRCLLVYMKRKNNRLSNWMI